MDSSNISVYLLEPIDDKNPRKKIVYAENPASARKAAAASNDPIDRIFADRDLSTCVQLEVDIHQLNNNEVKVQYNEVLYDLIKDHAEDVIAEAIL